MFICLDGEYRLAATVVSTKAAGQKEHNKFITDEGGAGGASGAAWGSRSPKVCASPTLSGLYAAVGSEDDPRRVGAVVAVRALEVTVEDPSDGVAGEIFESCVDLEAVATESASGCESPHRPIHIEPGTFGNPMPALVDQVDGDAARAPGRGAGRTV